MAYLRYINCIVDGLPVEGLRMDIDLLKTNRSKVKEPNSGVVNIYNMAQATRKKMSKIGATVIVNAGHLDSVPSPIFLGTLKEYSEPDVGPLNIMSSLSIEDTGIEDGRGIYELNAPLQFSPGFSASSIIAAISALTATPLVTTITKDYIYWNGYSFIGNIKKALDNIVFETLKLEWYVEGGKLYVVDPELPIVSDPLLLNSYKGLIGSPEELQEKDNNGEEITRYKFKSILMPRATIGQQVILNSKSYNGTFKIESIRQYGSTFDNDFYNEYVARRII